MNEQIEAQLIKSYIDGGYWQDITLGDFLRDCARKWPKNIAVLDAMESLTYEELNKASDSIACYLAKLGIACGDRILFQMKNCVWHTATLFGIAKAGAIPIMALGAHRYKELLSFAQRANPVAFITNEIYQGFNYPALAKEVQLDAPSIRDVLTVSDMMRAAHEGNVLTAEQYAKRRPEFTDPCVLTCSGGSTNVPKLIPRRHTDYLYDAQTFAAFLDMKQSDVYLIALPASHNFVFGNPGVLGTLSLGATAVMCENPSPDEILPMIDEHRVTITALVPAVLSAMLDTLSWDDAYDTTCLRLLLVGGAVLEEQLARKTLQKFPGCLRQVFGTAEGINFCTSANDSDDIVVSCQGKPISPADKWRIVNEDLCEVAQGESGELIALGAYTIQHYYNAPEAEDSFTADGYYRTGDKAHVSAEGNLVVEGRVTEQINRGGEKVMPSEIEGYLAAFPGIEEVQVVGVADELLGQRVCVYLIGEPEQTPEQTPTPMQLNSYLANLGVAAHKSVDQVRSIDSWPLTSVGKINRKLLCEWAAS
ncbi:MAG: AMP-binding protein [Coriobacteriales bacterium]|jgi:yersiniabactin salicyl-AMP ligase|nr:AMP-binding protein [Coriobacteriales bacterium]